MVVVGKRFGQPAFAHDFKRGAVSQAPLLICHTAVKIERTAELERRLRNDLDVWIRSDRLNPLDRIRPNGNTVSHVPAGACLPIAASCSQIGGTVSSKRSASLGASDTRSMRVSRLICRSRVENSAVPSTRNRTLR